MSVIIKTVEDE